MKPLISVRILIYNNCSKLEEVLISITRQTYSRVEVIISDDCSNVDMNHIQDIAEKYRKYFERIVVNRNKENVGTVKHMGIVNHLCNGDIWTTLGADDCFYDEKACEKIVEAFEKTNYSVITSARLREVGNGRLVILPVKRNQKLIAHRLEKLKKCMFRRYSYVSAIGTFYKRELLDEYDEYMVGFRLLEDYAMYVYFLLENYEIGFCDTISFVHAGGGVSSKKVQNPVLVEDNRNINDILLYNRKDELDKYTRRIVEFKYKKNRINKKNVFFYLCNVDMLLYISYVKLCKVFRTLEMFLKSKKREEYE